MKNTNTESHGFCGSISWRELSRHRWSPVHHASHTRSSRNLTASVIASIGGSRSVSLVLRYYVLMTPRKRMSRSSDLEYRIEPAGYNCVSPRPIDQLVPTRSISPPYVHRLPVDQHSTTQLLITHISECVSWRERIILQPGQIERRGRYRTGYLNELQLDEPGRL